MSKTAIIVAGVGAVALGAYFLLRKKGTPVAMSDIKSSPQAPIQQYALSLPNGSSNTFGLTTGDAQARAENPFGLKLFNPPTGADRFGLSLDSSDEYQLKQPGWSAFS
jgi:hypothetical protein